MAGLSPSTAPPDAPATPNTTPAAIASTADAKSWTPWPTANAPLSGWSIMADLTTNFAGIRCPNPFWLASGPPTNCGEQLMRAFDAGWGGAVWKTIVEPTVHAPSPVSSYHSHRPHKIGLHTN